MEEVDLSNSYLVLGGGMSGLITARELLKQNKQVVMLDAGKDNKDTAKKEEFKRYKKKFISPKFSLYSNSYAFSDFEELTRVKEKNFVSIGSLAYGGFSNIWGADIRSYNQFELSSLPFTIDEYNDSFGEIYNFITNISDDELSYEQLLEQSKSLKNPYIDNRCRDLIDSNIFRNMNIAMEHSDLAILYRDKGERKKCNFNGECLRNPAYIFNAKFEIEKLKDNKNFKYIPNTFIDSIQRHGNNYFINSSNLRDSTKTVYKTKKIYCSLGTLSTTKLVLKMCGLINKKIPLLTTPTASFILFSLKNQRKGPTRIATCNANFNLNYNEGSELITGGLFPFPKDWWVNKFGSGNSSSVIYGILDRFIFSRIIICTLNFSSNFSSNSISLNAEDELLIESKGHSEPLKKVFKTSLKVLKKAFLAEKYYLIPFTKKLSKPGEDIHLGGTLPASNLEESFSDFNGELKAMPNFFITDSSSLSFLAAKGQSFTAMAQSSLITKKSLI